MSKKEKIIDVAEALFNELGYTAVGVDLIRDAAGISKTSMYKYFGSKNQLINAVLERRHRTFYNSLKTAAESVTSPDEKLSAVINWHTKWFSDQYFYGCMFMHELAEFKAHDPELTAQAKMHKDEIKSLLFSLLVPGSVQTEIKAEMMMTFIEGMIVRAEFGSSGNNNNYITVLKTIRDLNL